MKIRILLSVFGAIAALPCHAATTFSFQQGDLRKDGTLYGSGATYAGTFDGSVTDFNVSGSATANTQDRMGNQNRTGSASAGGNGQQWSGLFSYDLSELSTFLASNPGFSVSAAAFSLTSIGGSHAGGSATIVLYQTEAFTGNATWSTSNGTDAWSTPVTSNGSGTVGGGTLASSSLGGGTVSTTISLGSAMTFSSSASFVSSVNDALARGDKTLYLLVQAATYASLDSYATFANNTNATTDYRPELSVTLIPEPSTALLGGFGLLALLRRRR